MPEGAKAVKDIKEGYCFRTDAKALMYGCYTIEEVKTNDSYRLTEGEPIPFTVSEDGKIVEAGSKENEVLYGRFELYKVDRETMISSALGGDTVVVFEELCLENALVAEHRDMNDAEQSVSIVKIDTNAHFKGTDSRKAAASAKMTVVDRVTVEGLT